MTYVTVSRLCSRPAEYTSFFSVGCPLNAVFLTGPLVSLYIFNRVYFLTYFMG
jgi:hypothetical protein